MLRFTLLGALCMLGTLWLVWRARTSTRAGALTIAVLAVYAWSLLSMLTTLAGTTLLSFRLEPTLTVLLTAAGAFGFIEVAQRGRARVQPENARRVVAAAAALGAIGALTFSQDIPDVLRSDIVVAYTDTDGNGAARRPATAGRRAVLPRDRRQDPARSPASRATRPSCSPPTTASCPTTRTTGSRA